MSDVNVIAVEGRIGHVERYRDKVYTSPIGNWARWARW